MYFWFSLCSSTLLPLKNLKHLNYPRNSPSFPIHSKVLLTACDARKIRINHEIAFHTLDKNKHPFEKLLPFCIQNSFREGEIVGEVCKGLIETQSSVAIDIYTNPLDWTLKTARLDYKNKKKIDWILKAARLGCSLYNHMCAKNNNK